MSTIIAWLTFAVLMVNAYAAIEPETTVEEKFVPIDDVCITSKCRNVTVEECTKIGKYWIPRNKNACCSQCIDCKPTKINCETVKCKFPICKWNEVYVSGDEVCDCCASCKKVECDPKRCDLVRCVGDRMENCKDDEVFVNPKGICNCCGGVCQKKKIRLDFTEFCFKAIEYFTDLNEK